MPTCSVCDQDYDEKTKHICPPCGICKKTDCPRTHCYYCEVLDCTLNHCSECGDPECSYENHCYDCGAFNCPGNHCHGCNELQERCTCRRHDDDDSCRKCGGLTGHNVPVHDMCHCH